MTQAGSVCYSSILQFPFDVTLVALMVNLERVIDMWHTLVDSAGGDDVDV